MILHPSKEIVILYIIIYNYIYTYKSIHSERKGRNTKRGPTSSLKLRHRQQPPKTKGTKKHLVWTLCELKDKKSINSPNKAIMK